MQSAIGIVYLVGAGPGDPELLTLKAARLLATTDVVVYDRIVHRAVLDHVRPHARLIYVGKEGGGDSVSQAEINDTLIAQARLGRMVVRLKGGDPFVFGRGAEEALALEAAGVVYEVVPGVSSGIGAPSAAAIPLTHRGVSRAVTPIGPARAVGNARRRRRESSHFGDFDRAGTHESSGWLAGFFDRYRLPMVSSIISAGAVAAIALMLRRPDAPPANPVVTDPSENVATKEAPTHQTVAGSTPSSPSQPGGGSNMPHPAAAPLRRSAPQVESLDVGEGLTGTVLALEDEDGGNTGVVWITPSDTTDTL